MTLKEIVTTAASCVIIVVTTVLLIQAGEVFDSISTTAKETQETVTGINLRRAAIFGTVENASAFTSHLPGASG